MNIGMILPSPDGTIFLNMAIYPGMGVRGMDAGQLMENFDDLDKVLDAARQFLRSQSTLSTG